MAKQRWEPDSEVRPDKDELIGRLHAAETACMKAMEDALSCMGEASKVVAGLVTDRDSLTKQIAPLQDQIAALQKEKDGMGKDIEKLHAEQRTVRMTEQGLTEMERKRLKAETDEVVHDCNAKRKDAILNRDTALQEAKDAERQLADRKKALADYMAGLATAAQ